MRAIKNSPKKVFETDYFLVTLDEAVMVLIIRFKPVENYGDNFSCLYDVKTL